MTHHIDLATITLGKGSHTGPTPGKDPADMCVMEAVAWFAGEPWSDHPACVSPVIGAFLRVWNDGLSDTDRQMLVPWIPLVVGTRTTDADEATRAWLAVDWLTRTCAPAWLRLAGIDAHAEALERLAPLTDAARAAAAMRPILAAARGAARDAAGAVAGAAWDDAMVAASDAAGAARDAAEDAAGAVAGDAARAAAWAAAGDDAMFAAWDDAMVAAGAVAGDAARAAAGFAARAAARAAAWGAARDAASDAAAAAGDAAAAAWDAAEDAAGAALRPTVVSLQASARELLTAMIAVGRVEPVGVAR